MDGNVIATIGSAMGVLGGVYAIVNHTENRLRMDLGKRIEDTKETLRAETKAAAATLELKMAEMENRLDKRIEDTKETLRAETKIVATTLEAKLAEMENRLLQRVDSRIVRG